MSIPALAKALIAACAPGPGVPPAIVSGKLVSDLIIKDEINI